jgi:hypothetical protein
MCSVCKSKKIAKTTTRLHVAVIDIGKLENIGWAVSGPSVCKKGRNLDQFIDALARAFAKGPLALGFEAPMYVPFRNDITQLDKCRAGESDRAFGASAGACVLAKSLVIVPYVLSALKRKLSSKKATPKFRWQEALSRNDILLFEAFVTHETADHIGCALKAINRFHSVMMNASHAKSDLQEPSSLNLLGAMLLRIGWCKNPSILGEPVLVIRHKGAKKHRARKASIVT